MPTGIYERKPRKPKMSSCHPKIKHFAKGMCKKCYWRDYYKSHPRVRRNRKEADKRYYLKNKSNLSRQSKRYYKKNRDKILRYAAAYQKVNSTKHNTASAAYRKRNQALYNAFGQKRRTAKTKAGGSFTIQEWVALCKKYDYRCLCCNRRRKLTADHVIPVSKGGTSNIDNIQPLCGPCNSSKRDKTIDYRREP